jgi:hypothetical protein
MCSNWINTRILVSICSATGLNAILLGHPCVEASGSRTHCPERGRDPSLPETSDTYGGIKVVVQWDVTVAPPGGSASAISG